MGQPDPSRLFRCRRPRVEAGLAGLILLLGAPAAPAQLFPLLGALFQPTATDDKRSALTTEKWLELEKNGQQAWHITKGKDFAQLPKEFQWDKAPTPVDTPFPVYPFEKLDKGEAGKVQVYFAVGPDGRTYGAQLEETSAPEFGEAVLAMIDACRFNPPMKDGKPGYAYLGCEYRFSPTGHSDGPVSPDARRILRDLKKASGNIVTLNQLDQPLKPVVRPGPVYPAALKKEHPAGSAEVEFYVDEDGKAQLPRVLSCSAPAFGYAVVQAVAAWRFEAPKREGKSVVVRVRLPIDFEGGKPAAAPK